jgi:hypothetical protein
VVDLFEEVEEEIRSDHYLNLARRSMPWITALFALVIVSYLGFWGYKAWQDRNLNAASVAYQNGIDALGQGDQTGAKTAFDTAIKAGAPGYKSLALMQEAALQATAGKADAAAALYDQAAKVAPSPAIADLASLKAAEVVLDTAPFNIVADRLRPLTDVKRPYWLYAKEALAMAELLAGKTADARRDFELIPLQLGATDDMRQRSQEAIALIDAGEAPAAIAAVKAAATMPTTPPLTLTAPPPAAGQAAPAAAPAGAAQ